MQTPPQIRAGRNPAYPAGPRLTFRLLTRLLFGGRERQSSTDFMRSLAREYGDLNFYRIAGRNIYLLNHPDLIADFFGKDSKHHHRNFVMQQARDVLGNGLLTSEEPQHMQMRRLAQPAFLRARIAGYGAVIGEKTMDMTEGWQSGTVLDMHKEVLELALRIVGKCLFDLDTLDDVAAIEGAVNSFMDVMPLSFLPFNRIVRKLPIPALRRMHAGRALMDRIIYGIIAERRADPRDRGDLLSMLLNATDADDPAAAMTDTQLRDECVTVMLAGHETTANALAFALDLLATHPEVQQRLHQESAAVLGDRVPAAQDYAQLGYATQVFAEAMRLYPPVWVTGRAAAEPYEIAGFTVPKGAALMAPQCVVHRDPRWWTDPDRFDPDRFTEAEKAKRPRLTYFPFGGGSRQCIAEGLAWMEGTLALAAIARDWRLQRAPGNDAPLKVQPAVSLRPAKGVPLLVERR